MTERIYAILPDINGDYRLVNMVSHRTVVSAAPWERCYALKQTLEQNDTIRVFWQKEGRTRMSDPQSQRCTQ